MFSIVPDLLSFFVQIIFTLFVGSFRVLINDDKMPGYTTSFVLPACTFSFASISILSGTPMSPDDLIPHNAFLVFRRPSCHPWLAGLSTATSSPVSPPTRLPSQSTASPRNAFPRSPSMAMSIQACRTMNWNSRERPTSWTLLFRDKPLWMRRSRACWRSGLLPQ